MAIIDRFVLQYIADTREAERNIQNLETRARRPGAAAQQAGRDAGAAFESLGQDAERFAERVTNRFTGMNSAIGELSGAVAGLGPVFAVLSVGVAASFMTIKTGIDAANKAIEEFKDLRKEAFEGQTSENALLRAQALGRALGVSNEGTSSSVKGLNEKAFQIAMLGANGAPVMYGDPTLRLRQAWERRGVTAVRRDGTIQAVEKTLQQMADAIKKEQATHGEEMARSVGVKQFGLDLEYVNKVLATSSEELRKAANLSVIEAGKKAQLSQETYKLIDAQNKAHALETSLSNTIAIRTVPAMTDLTKQYSELLKASEPLAKAIGDLASKFLSLTATVVQYLGKAIDEFNHPEARKQAYTQARAQAEAELKAFALTPAGQQIKGQLNLERAFAKTHGVEYLDDYVFKLQNEKLPGLMKQENASRGTNAIEAAQKSGALASVTQGYSKEVVDDAMKRLSGMSGQLSSENEVVTTLRQILEESKGINKQATANVAVAKQTNQLIAQQADIGIQQALAMLAAGIGQGAKLEVAGGKSAAGMTISDYNDFYLKKRKELAGKAYVGVGADLTGNRSFGHINQVMSEAGQQAEKATAPKERTTGPVASINVGGVNITSSATDPVRAGQEMATLLARQLVDVVNDYAGPLVS